MEYAGSGVVTRQGQITVPKKIRESTGMETGTVLDFYFNQEMMIVRPKKSPLRAFIDLADRTSERFTDEGITSEDVRKEIEKVRIEGGK